MKHKFFNTLAILSLILGSLLPGWDLQPVQAALIAQDPKPVTAQVDPAVPLNSLPLIGKFTVLFDQPMDPESSPNPLIAYPFTAGDFAWSEEFTRLEFSPRTPYEGMQHYVFFLDKNLRSAGGQPVSPPSYWDATTTSGPSVIKPYPLSGHFDSLRPAFTVKFDRPMDEASLTAAFQVTPSLGYTLTLQTNQMVVTLVEGMAPDTVYTFLINGQATDREGNPLQEPFSWNAWSTLQVYVNYVTTAAHPDIRVNFSQPLDMQATGLPFEITPKIEGQWEWANEKQAIFRLVDPLPYGQKFNLEVTGTLIAKNGDALIAPANLPRITAPPPIVSISPGHNEYSLEEGEDIEVIFAIPMDHTSTEAAFRTQPYMAGTFEWNDKAMRFTPDWNAAPVLQKVTFSIDTSALSFDKKRVFSEPYQFSLYVSWNTYDDTTMTFGIDGANIQVVDSRGRRAVQFSARKLPTYLKFSLYRYDLTEYAHLLSYQYRNRNFYEKLHLVDTSDRQTEVTWEQMASKDNVENDFIQELLIPEEVEPGLFLLNAEEGGVIIDQLYIVLTQYALTVKRSSPDVLVWVTNTDGENIPEAEVRLYSTKGEKLREGFSNDQGIYRTTVPQGYPPSFLAARLPDGEVTLSGFSGWRSTGDYDWTINRQGRTPYQLYVYSDRPIYQPGQPVNFKIIARQDQDIKYMLPPEGTVVSLDVMDERHNVLQSQSLPLNSFGTANGVYTLTVGTMLGSYQLRASLENSRGFVSFKVEDYRKPDYQASLKMSDDVFIAGEDITATLKVEYLFGKPVSDANVKINIYGYGYYGWDLSTSMNGKTDATGYLEIQFKAPKNEEPEYRDWISSLEWDKYDLEVTVDDGSGSPVIVMNRFTVYSSPYKIEMDAGGYYHKPGQPIPIIAKATTLDGNPVSDLELSLSVKQYDDWDGYRDASEPLSMLTTQKDGSISYEYTPPMAGYYELILTYQKPGSVPISVSRWFYAHNQDWISRFDRKEIRIQALQDRYAPYQTGRFLIESAFSGPALLTFERGRVLHYEFIELTAPVTIIEPKIIPEDAPNVFVTVNAWTTMDNSLSVVRDRGEEYYYIHSIADQELFIDRVEIEVDQIEQPLVITVQTDQSVYAPRQVARLDIQVSDHRGNPVQAELSLAVVDEAIFNLSEPLNRSIFSFFYGKRDLSVYTYDSFAPGRVFSYPGDRGGGDDGGIRSDVRSEFPDTALWIPAMRTNVQGKASVEIKLPDSLTSWRVTIYAVTRSTQVGETFVNLLTQKETIVQPFLPRLLIEGDRLNLGAMVHNYAPVTRTLEVSLYSPGLLVAEPLTQTLVLAPNQVSPVSWQVSALSAGVANLRFQAFDSTGGDTVELPLSIAPNIVPASFSQSGQLTGLHEVGLALPPNTYPDSSVTLRLDRSPATTLLEGAEYLIGYPYGCVEQTMSRALPNAVIGRAANSLGISPEMLASLKAEYLPASVNRLYAFQHYDGGWGWWMFDSSDVYQTAWVLFGLAVVAESGYPIETRVLEDAAEYLESYARDDDLNPNIRAFIHYSKAYAGFGDKDAAVSLTSQAKNLDEFGLAALALALHRLEETDQAREVLTQLEARLLVQGMSAYLGVSSMDGEYRNKSMASGIRTTALALSAFAHIDPSNPSLDQIAQYLMDNRQAQGWGTTNETAFALLGLTDWLLAKRSGTQPVGYTVSLDGQQVISGVLDLDASFIEKTFPTEALVGTQHSLLMEIEEGSSLYYTIQQSVSLANTIASTGGDISVERKYLDPKTKQVLEEIVFGQTVMVQLTVTMPDDSWYVIIEDNVPGGLTALNERLNDTVRYSGSFYNLYDDIFIEYADRTGYNFKEIRGGKVSFFLTHLGPGKKTITYMARATHSGTFTALPAEIYAMYDPEFNGYSTVSLITVNLVASASSSTLEDDPGAVTRDPLE